MLFPTSTGAAKAVGKVISELDEKIDGTAVCISTITGSMTELCSILNKKVTVEEVNTAMKKLQLILSCLPKTKLSLQTLSEYQQARFLMPLKRILSKALKDNWLKRLLGTITSMFLYLTGYAR